MRALFVPACFSAGSTESCGGVPITWASQRGGAPFSSASPSIPPFSTRVSAAAAARHPNSKIATTSSERCIYVSDIVSYVPATRRAGYHFSGPHVVIIRGPEIRFHDNIPIRDSLNPGGEDFPHAEGWGPIRGQVDFATDGPSVSLTVPWSSLGETDGKFSYHLIALQRGAL